MLLEMNVATRKFTLQKSYNLHQILILQRSSYLAAWDYRPDNSDVPSETQLSIDKVSLLYYENYFKKTLIFLVIMHNFVGFRCPDSNWRDFSVAGIVLGMKKIFFLFSTYNT